MYPSLQISLRLPASLALLVALHPFAATAQPVYAPVLAATPIYEQVAVPQETCRTYSSYQRCETSTTYEDRIVGYNVTYTYQGQQYTQRMAHNPGQRVPVQTSSQSHSYSSNNTAPANSVTPGALSYSSTPPGAPAIDSIQYQSNDADLPINLDMHLGRPHRPK